MVVCPICSKEVLERYINEHIDGGCAEVPTTEPNATGQPAATQPQNARTPGKAGFSNFFTPRASQLPSRSDPPPAPPPFSATQPARIQPDTKPANVSFEDTRTTTSTVASPTNPLKRSADHTDDASEPAPPKRAKPPSAFEKVQPLAERMRPRTLDDVCGQSLVSQSGVLRGLIETDRVPSMILWGGPGTGKTTIARLISKTAGTRFVEINSTSSGVPECKRLFAEARNELALTGRKTIIFCDEIHRFSKSQQDVFLGPVEAGHITLIGATTENPSFKVVNALLSRCRVFTLAKLGTADIVAILERALDTHLRPADPDPPSSDDTAGAATTPPPPRPPLLDAPFLEYLAAFADGDARTALNLLELAADLSARPGMTTDALKAALTQTLVYDRAGDQHYNTISAFHKAVRGSSPDAALYYLARMLQSGEDPVYVARRMVVIASEDVGLADGRMLPLAVAAHTAAEKLGMPEARIPLAHCAVALALAPKSTRAYRGLANAYAALAEPGVAGLPIPLHLLNAPTRLMKEVGYGREYKYNPDFVDGEVLQEYLPDKLRGRRFLEDGDFGNKVDDELVASREAGSKGEEERKEERGESLVEHGDTTEEDDGEFVIGDGQLETSIY